MVAGVFLLLPAVILARSLVTIGAVGGADPGWLANASRWWLLEVGALAAAANTGYWLASHPRLRDEQGAEAMRRALAAIVTMLLAASAVEVLTA